MNKKTPLRIIIVIAFALFSTIGTVVQFFATHYTKSDVDITSFKSELTSQLIKADKYAQVLIQQLPNQENLINHLSSDPNSPAAYVYFHGKLKFWSSNEFSFQFPKLTNKPGWNYELSSNVHALFKWHIINDSVSLLMLIPVKAAFPYENQHLSNTFFKPFNIPGNVNIYSQPTDDCFSVTDQDGNFMFSIQKKAELKPTGFMTWVGFLSFSSAFILLILLYLHLTLYSRNQQKKRYLIYTIAFAIFISLMSWFNCPGLFFQNPVFSAQHYTVNRLFASFTHLTVFVIFIVAALYSYSTIFRNNTNRILTFIILIVYLWGFSEFLQSIILHSGMHFNFYLLSEVTFLNAWAHFLLFVALAGGYCVLNVAFPRIFNLSVSVAGLYIIISTLLSLGITHHLNQHKNHTKYKIQTENIRINGTSRQDPIAELLLEQLAYNLQSDTLVSHLALSTNPDSDLYDYIDDRHLGLFSNKFDVSFSFIDLKDANSKEYLMMLKHTGSPVGSTGFFTLPSSLFETTYAGIIPINGENDINQNAILFEFQNKRNFRSYSFPDLLINETTDITLQKNISIANYENNQLVFSDQRINWPDRNDHVVYVEDGFHKVKTETGVVYVNQKENQQICIAELNTAGQKDKIFYFILIVVLFLVSGKILMTLHILIHHRRQFTIGLTGKFQLVFISLLMISFISTLLFSVNYFRHNYEQEQIQLSENKKHYIQASLQEAFFWVNDFSTVNEQNINNILQEFAYRYQTDIHLYNQHGELAGSSQNLIFSKQLLSKLISPAVIFSDETPAYQYEKIGRLNYLATYTDLLNGDFLPIGYIAIPQYFSQNEINTKINQFLIAIVQIYTLIIILSILLVVIAGNRLANPLRLLEEKLKTMKLDGSNARIDYRGHDEIGQLVEQYNKTVDELEQSTRMLLQSERESAWRTMARQVAHEINNPLTPMKLTIQQLQRIQLQAPDLFAEYFKTATSTLIEQIDNLSRIAGTFSQFARLPETEMQPVDVAARLVSTVELFKNNQEEVELTFEGVKEGVIVKGDPEQLTRVFNNLLKNAVQAIPADRSGLIRVSLYQHSDSVEIHVTDNGAGISSENKLNIFKPNFTTKSSGMGLGLSISRAIIENAGGTITFNSDMSKGSTFSIYLPLMV